MGNIKINSKFVLFQGIESVFYCEQSKCIIVKTFSGEEHKTNIDDEETAMTIINNLFEKIHKYSRGLR